MSELSDGEIAELIGAIGVTAAAQKLGVNVRNMFALRRRVEQRLGKSIQAGPFHRPDYDHRISLDIDNGVVIVGSDAHYWPGIVSTAHRAFVKACGEMANVKAVVMNGDVFDGASVSRHQPIGWESNPSVVDEVEACRERLGEIIAALSKQPGKPARVWTLGNHDARFETRLASVAPEFAKVHGVHLKDHFPEWENAWSVWVNDTVVIKHRYRGGIHATHNNTVNSGKSVVTGHLHSLKVTPWSDYNGTRYGVDTGTLAQVGGKQFVDYLEDNPVNWRAGFVILTFVNGRLVWPEVVHVVNEATGLVEFRGREWNV